MEATKPYLTIVPATGWSPIELKELWQFRELLVTLASRDVKLRYRQTVLGVLWVVLQPLMGAGILSFVFNRVGKMPSGGPSPFLFTYAGLLGWNAFSNALGRSSSCLVGSAHLISKVYFPRLTIPLSTLLATLLDFVVGLGLFAVLLPLFDVWPGLRILTLPVWLFFILALSMGIGLFASALTVSYRDVTHIMPVAIQFLFWASPIAYGVSRVPEKYQSLYLMNPMAGLLEAFHWSTVGSGSMRPGVLAYSCGMSILVLIFGAFAFKRMERRFADVI